MAAQKKNKKKKFRLSGFGRFLVIYSGCIVVIMLVLLFLLYGLLKDYEGGIPDNTMAEIARDFTPDRVETLIQKDTIEISEFESTDYIVQYLKDALREQTVSYKRKSGEYTNNNPVYLVLAGEKPIAKVKLADNGLNGHKFQTWKLGEIIFDGFVDASGGAEITAPSAAVVKINGVVVKDSYVTETDIVVSETRNVGEYTEVATSRKIKVDKLMTTPVVTAELDGKELEAVWVQNQCTFQYPKDDALLAEITDRALTVSESYGRYIINRGNLSQLQSHMVGNAKELVSDIPAIWAYLYGKTYTYEFRNESVTNLVKYSDTCVSCQIHYDLYVDWTAGNTNYDTNMVYTFVKIDGVWYLADFSIL